MTSDCHENLSGTKEADNHGQQNETKDKHRTHNTTLKTKAGETRTLLKPG